MEDPMIAWWLWFLIGILLLLAEFASAGGFFLFFFGVGALAVAVLSAIGIHLPLRLELLLFLGLSITSLVLLRKRLRLRFDSTIPDKEVDRLENETAVALEEIAVDGIGKAELRGATWNARNGGSRAILRDERCRVTRVEGLTLWIDSEPRP
jgi:membrane protein implicated in regulation of membrane protease activity